MSRQLREPNETIATIFTITILANSLANLHLDEDERNVRVELNTRATLPRQPVSETLAPHLASEWGKARARARARDSDSGFHYSSDLESGYESGSEEESDAEGDVGDEVTDHEEVMHTSNAGVQRKGESESKAKRAEVGLENASSPGGPQTAAAAAAAEQDVPESGAEGSLPPKSGSAGRVSEREHEVRLDTDSTPGRQTPVNVEPGLSRSVFSLSARVEGGDDSTASPHWSVIYLCAWDSDESDGDEVEEEQAVGNRKAQGTMHDQEQKQNVNQEEEQEQERDVQQPERGHEPQLDAEAHHTVEPEQCIIDFVEKRMAQVAKIYTLEKRVQDLKVDIHIGERMLIHLQSELGSNIQHQAELLSTNTDTTAISTVIPSSASVASSLSPSPAAVFHDAGAPGTPSTLFSTEILEGSRATNEPIQRRVTRTLFDRFMPAERFGRDWAWEGYDEVCTFLCGCAIYLSLLGVLWVILGHE